MLWKNSSDLGGGGKGRDRLAGSLTVLKFFVSTNWLMLNLNKILSFKPKQFSCVQGLPCTFCHTMQLSYGLSPFAIHKWSNYFEKN